MSTAADTITAEWAIHHPPHHPCPPIVDAGTDLALPCDPDVDWYDHPDCKGWGYAPAVRPGDPFRTFACSCKCHEGSR